MASVLVRICVDQAGRISGQAPVDLPPGEYAMPVAVPPKRCSAREIDLPVDDEPWDDSISLRREDLYDDQGR